MKLIWGMREENYFCKQDWTGQIRLIRLKKLGFARKSAAGVEVTVCNVSGQ
jgi:hypothetical protein